MDLKKKKKKRKGKNKKPDGFLNFPQIFSQIKKTGRQGKLSEWLWGLMLNLCDFE